MFSFLFLLHLKQPTTGRLFLFLSKVDVGFLRRFGWRRVRRGVGGWGGVGGGGKGKGKRWFLGPCEGRLKLVDGLIA